MTLRRAASILGLLLASVVFFAMADQADAAPSRDDRRSTRDSSEAPVDVDSRRADVDAELASRRQAFESEATTRRQSTQAAVQTPTRAAVSAEKAKPAPPVHDSGTLYLLQPDPAVPATFIGRGGYSADGLAQKSPGTLQADIPAGSTVEHAYLYGYYLTLNPTPAELTTTFDGVPLALTKIDDFSCCLSSARADVTTQVASKVGSGGGIFNFTAQSSPQPLDGLALLVIYSNPALPESTIAVFDGAALQAGDTATFSFAAPLDKTIPGFSARMSLGIGFSYQQQPGHFCGVGSPVSKQYSRVDVNGQRLTTCAGNYDDGLNLGGFTVGGVGDLPDNPADPFQSPGDGATPRVLDDELYDLAPFLNQGDTKLVVTTAQPSNDDILFLSVISVAAKARVTTELCGDGKDQDGDGLVDLADPDCQVTQPVVQPSPAIPVVTPVAEPLPVVLHPRTAEGVPPRASPEARTTAPLARTGSAASGLLALTAAAFLLTGLALAGGGRRRHQQPKALESHHDETPA